jgi:sugar phosphate isomerase/epimerase
MPSVSRRQFLATACVAAGSDLYAAPATPRIGIEVYSLLGQIGKDPAATLKQVAAIGYETIELATYIKFGSAAAVRKMLDDAGLACPSLHVSLEPIQEAIDFAKTLGAKYLVAGACWKKDVPAAQADVLAVINSLTLDDYKWSADLFNKNGERAKSAGLEFAFHNHNFDFKKLAGGVVGYDELLRLTDPDLVKLELDCGWMAVAGASPAEYLRKYGSRYRLLHIRDFKSGFPHSLVLGPAEMAQCVPLGEGSIDYRPIFAAAKEIGVREYLVEQEPSLKAPLAETLKVDYDYLTRNLNR